MVQIIKEIRKPSFGQQLVEGISRGVQGVSQIGVEVGKQREREAKVKADRLKGFSTTFDKYTKAFKEEVPGQISKSDKEAIMLRARAMVEEGEDPEEAIRKAWDMEMAPKEGTKGKKEPGFKEKILEGFSPSGSAKETLKAVGESIYGAGAPFGGAAAGFVQFPLTVLKEIGKAGRKGIGHLAGLSPEEIEEREKKFAADIKAGEEATGVINPLAGTSLPEGLASATGGRSVAQTPAQTIISAAVAGPEGVLAAAAEVAAEGLGLPSEIAAALGISTFILAGRGQVVSKIENFAKRSLNKAEKIGAKVNAPPEEILKQAEEMGGVDMNKVNEGNGKEIQKLDRALNEIEKKTSEVFKESEKFGREEGERIRTETARKLADSPLAKYYEPTVKEPKTVEGKVAKEMRQAPLRKQVEQLEAFIKTPEFRMAEPMERERVLHELREAQFELKWGRKPVTQEQLTAQIEKQHAQMREYIAEPTAKKIQEIQKQIKKDVDAIKEAEKIAARGELPGARVVDEFIKIHEEYLKGYAKLAEELSEFVRKNQAVKGREPQLKRAQELIDLLEEMSQVGKAKVAMQTEKRKALGALEKPSGAFYKQQLKDLHSEVEQFQKQFFKTQKILSPEARKAAKIGKKEIGKVPEQTQTVLKTAKEAIKDPSVSKVEKLAEETGADKETLGQYLKRVRKGVEEIKENPTENKAESVARYMIFPRWKTLKKQIRNAVVLATVSTIAEEGFGVKLPSYIIRSIGAAFGVVGGTINTTLTHYVQEFFNSQHAKELKQLRRNPEGFSKKIQSLDKRYSKARVNKIIKAMKEED